MSSSFAAIAGGIGGAIAVLALVFGFGCYCWLKHKNSSNKNSETGSSDPSAAVESNRGGGTSSSQIPPIPEPRGAAAHFTVEELEQATKNFDESNLIGYGSFGPVYKGLLRDGNFVAIKRRMGAPRQEFIEEVAYLSRIWHRNLATLLGFCQEHGYQMLVFEHLPNGSMCNHLYDTGEESTTTIEFKQRISICLGAAKGLCHLHSQRPPIAHGNFKTANVLVDENFISKVADAGVFRLLQKIEEAGPSSMEHVNVFRDPEIGQMGIFSETNDLYGFGIFLLELVTGQEASYIDSFGSNESILRWVERHLSSNDLVDRRLVGSFTAEGMKDFIRLALHCMSFPGKRRPKMQMVVSELDRILEKEIALTTVMGESSSTTVTLGSQLFTSEMG